MTLDDSRKLLIVTLWKVLGNVPGVTVEAFIAKRKKNAPFLKIQMTEFTFFYCRWIKIKKDKLYCYSSNYIVRRHWFSLEKERGWYSDLNSTSFQWVSFAIRHHVGWVLPCDSRAPYKSFLFLFLHGILQFVVRIEGSPNSSWENRASVMSRLIC